MQGARVVGGAAGLDRRVRHVNVMEVPDILGWVKADELLLTTAYPLRDDAATLARLIPNLDERGLAGLALKPARYISAIPDHMVESADRLAFPLIELPPESSFNEIINSVLTVILNAQALRLQRSAEIHERFTDIVLVGGGLREIAEALSRSIGRPVGIVTAGGAFQASSAGSERLGRLRQAVPAGDGDAGDRDPHPAIVTIDGETLIVQSIQVGRERFGSIVVLDPGTQLADDDADAIEYAATVAALRQVQARAVAEADRRFQAICLEELVSGHVERTALMERAHAFKWDLAVPRAVIIAQVDSLAGRPFAELAGRPDEVVARRRLTESARGSLGRGAIVWERSAEIAALVPIPPGSNQALRELAARLAAESQRAVPQGTISVGVGRVVQDPLRLADSWREARRALQIGSWGRGPGGVTLYQDLGVDRLLIAMPESDLGVFVTATIGPLLEHDARHRTDLAGTLEAYLGLRNAALAARRLFVHYNTLKNRLALIEELLGYSLDDPDRSLALALALRIRRLPRS
jgi:purine catabolism regulator